MAEYSKKKDIMSELTYDQSKPDTAESAEFTESDHNSNRWQSFKDSFKRYEVHERYDYEGYQELTDLEKANIKTAKSPLKRELKQRHLQMIAIGSAIGSGLLVASGGALHTGGPLAVILGWTLTGLSVFTTIQALGELAVTFPISGSFNVYASRFIDPSIGFAVAWNYFFQYLVLLPLELVAGSITMQYWTTSINPDVWVLIFYLLVISINMFGVRAYGEAEFIFLSIKVTTVTMFIIVCIVIAAGGAPNGEPVGSKYWRDPGPLANGFKGVASIFVSSAFAYAGTELVALTAAETHNPRVDLPKATKQVFWRILLFYMVSLILICFLIPFNDDRLLGDSSVDVTASPFVIAIVSGGIPVLPSIMNAVILVSVISVGSSSVYATSRTLLALAEQGFAPKICGYVDRKGRPLVAILITNIFGLLSFIAASGKQGEIFNWLLSISGLSSIFTWLSICLAHLRFRRALFVQNRTTDELAFKSQTGTIGSLYGFILYILVLIAQFWVALFPLGEKPNAKTFFSSYLGFVVLVVFYVGHKIWKNNWILFLRAKDIDVDTGRRETDIEALKVELAEERALLRSKPLIHRIYHFWC